ncbi:MAG: DivIVA domain-containing protein [Actinomycetota bacterium]
MRKKKTEDEAAPTAQPQNRQRLTPADIQQAEFRLSMRGYNEREVDELLDRLTEDWGVVLEENKRLRDGVSISAPASDTAVADAKREAEAILAKARQDAAEIVRNASQQTSAPVTSPAGAAEVAAVSAFLTKERDFLQSLGRLVQGHAESVKSMAQSSKSAETRQDSRPAAAAAPSAPAAQAPPKPPARPPSAQPKPAADAAPTQTERKPSEPAPPQKTPQTTGAPTQPVVKIDGEENIPQPVPQANAPTAQRAQSSPPASTPVPASEAAKQQPAAIRIPEDGGERAPATSAAERSGAASEDRDEELSLRELFWGDE